MTSTDHNSASDADDSRANTFPWPPVLFVGAIAAAWAFGRFAPLSWPGLDDGPARAIGWAFGLIGAGLIAWAIVALQRHGTTVMPDAASTVLVTSGPYRRFRNPFYLGETLLLLATAELTKNIWFVASAAAFAVLVTRLQILPEERHLAARFGEAYASYKSASRRWI